MSDLIFVLRILLIGLGLGLGLAAAGWLVARQVRQVITAAVEKAVAASELRITEKALGMVRDITQTRASAPADSIRDRVLAEKELFTLGAQRDLLADIRREMNGKGEVSK